MNKHESFCWIARYVIHKLRGRFTVATTFCISFYLKEKSKCSTELEDVLKKYLCANSRWCSSLKMKPQCENIKIRIFVEHHHVVSLLFRSSLDKIQIVAKKANISALLLLAPSPRDLTKLVGPGTQVVNLHFARDKRGSFFQTFA